MAQNVGCLGFLMKKKIPEEVDELPYRIRDDFLSNAEYSFYKVLIQIFGSKYTICPKVSLSDIFFVRRPNINQAYLNKINRKHVDFLVCDSEMMKPIIGIELDDKSHNKQKRLDRDTFVEEVFNAAGLPLGRVRVADSYNINDLKNYFSHVYRSQKTQAVMQSEADREANAAIQDIEQINNQERKHSNTTDSGIEKFCPKCNLSLIVRTSRSGVKFYGCPNFPKCKYSIDY